MHIRILTDLFSFTLTALPQIPYSGSKWIRVQLTFPDDVKVQLLYINDKDGHEIFKIPELKMAYEILNCTSADTIYHILKPVNIVR